jgi:YidC/Oxa1 family membrane protein insertase
MVLVWVHSMVGNWGWAIIIVTALIKLLFYPLSQASGRSMAKMRAIAPRMKQIQDSYKDDREKLGRAMMDLYKKEKINPLAGCLPMVVQIPFFISFYWVLLESVEMRQAPFMLWINDLSSRDPFFVLPLLMGSAMFAQFKVESRAARSHAGEDHAIHAPGHDGHDGVVPLRSGALLVDQHRAVHRAAVAGESGRAGGDQ